MNDVEFKTQTVRGVTTIELSDPRRTRDVMAYASDNGIRRFDVSMRYDSLAFVDEYQQQIDALFFADPSSGQLDLSPIYRHPALKRLQFRREGGPPPDLARLPSLEYFCGKWHPDLHLSEAKHLRDLCLFSCKARSLVDFPWPPHLEKLDFTLGSLVSVEGIEKAPRSLVRLELHNLRSLVAVEISDGSSLRELQMDTCGKASLVRANRELRLLSIFKCAPMPSLAFLASLPDVESVGFDRLIDGNLQPIVDHPKIRHVQMENKKHYSHTDLQIDVIVRPRGGYAVFRVEDLGNRPVIYGSVRPD